MVTINLAEILYEHFHIANVRIDVESLLAQNDLRLLDVDMPALLSNSFQIAVVFGIEDVRRHRPDLTEQQAWLILQSCQDSFDPEAGINLPIIRQTADHLFPAKDASGASQPA